MTSLIGALWQISCGWLFEGVSEALYIAVLKSSLGSCFDVMMQRVKLERVAPIPL